MRKDKPKLELLVPGTKISQDLSGNSKFEVTGDEATPEILKTIEMVIPGKDSNLHASIIGATGKKAIGDTWPIDSKAAAKELEGMQVDAKDVTGQIQLLQVGMINGVESLSLQCNMQAKNVKPNNKWPNLNYKSSEISVQHDAALPIDKHKNWVQFNSYFTLKADLEGTSSEGNVTMEMRSEFNGEIKRTYGAVTDALIELKH